MDDPVEEIPNIIRTLCTAPPPDQRATIETYFTSTASFTHPFCRTGSSPYSRWLVMEVYRWFKILSPHIDVWVDSVAFDKDNLLVYVSIHQNFKLWVVPFYNAPVKLVTVLHLTTDSFTPSSHAKKATNSSQNASTVKEQDDSRDGEQKTSVFEKENATPNRGKKKVLFTSPPDDRKRAKPLVSENPFRMLASPSPDPEFQERGGREKYYIQSQNDLYQTSEWIKFLVPWGVGVFLMIAWQFWATFLCVIGTKAYDVLTWAPRKLYATHPEVFDNSDKVKLGAD